MQFTIDEINKQFKNKLKNVYSNAEIQQILFLMYENVLGYSKIKVLTNQKATIDETKYNELMLMQERLFNNEPIQYIIGETYFYDLLFNVDASVLIPRPETEELVEWIIDSCSTKNYKILDIGTGSGCIAISLAKNIVNSTVFAVDISNKALSVAKNNATQNKVDVNFIEHNILNDFDALPYQVDIIVSNPPYIKNNEKPLMQKNVLDYEPDIALFVSDNDPLIFYRKIAEIGLNILNKKGVIFFEINEALGGEMNDMLNDLNYSEIEIRKDINGKDRMVKAVFM